MKTFMLCIALTGLLLSGKASHAEEKGKPLNLTLRAGQFTLSPQLMLDRVERKEDPFSKEPSLPLDGKTKTIVLPALQATSGGVTTKIGVRPKKGGMSIKMEISW